MVPRYLTVFTLEVTGDADADDSEKRMPTYSNT